MTMKRLDLRHTSPTVRAAILAGGLLALVLIGIWASRTMVQLPAFLPHIDHAFDGSISSLLRGVLALAIIVLGFGTPLFLLIRRNGQLTRAREALRTREAEFRAFAEAGSDWLWTTDADFRLTTLYGGRSHNLEVEKARTLGKTLTEIVDARQVIDNPAKWRRLQEDIDAHRPFRDFEVTLRRRSGKVRHLSLSAVPAFDDRDTFLGYRGITADITKRKQAERALRLSEARFGDFAASASDWFWETDADLRFTYISGRVHETFGVPADFALGKTREELADPSERMRRPDAWRSHLEDLRQCRPFRNFEYESDLDSGGRRVIVSSGVPVFDNEGRFTGYRGSATDVTNYRRTERESLEYLRQFRLLADNLPILIAHVDADWRFAYVNKTAEVWYNQPRRDIIGKLYQEVVGSDLDSRSEPTRKRVLAGETVREEAVARYPDGKTRTVERLLLPDFQPGEPPRVYVMAVDVTEQRHLEEQLRQNLKMEALGKLTGGVAHDFNNLLLAIQGNLEFLRDEPVDASLMPFVNNALRGVDRAADLTRRLLAFSRRQPLAPRAVDVGHLITDMDDLLERTLDALIEVRIDPGTEPATALVDPGQLENALLNLAINARDAMPDGGTLTLRVRGVDAVAPAGEGQPTVAARYVCIEVADTGTGMPDSVREHAFEPFFTTKQIGHGTGLGLSMVHGFVKQSGGFAQIDTELGAGTTIRLYLPAAAATDARRTAAGDLPAPSRALA
jgi:PAS domain S-box-containing protein